MRPPDVVIGGRDNPYLRRWHLIPRNRWFGVYLHQFLRDDDNRALHDHPKPNLSIILCNPYHEVMFVRKPIIGKPLPPTIIYYRRRFLPVFRWASTAHRVLLPEDKPCWSIFITGPSIREWGFWCPLGRWVHWMVFNGDADNYEATDGPGCAGE